MGGLADGTSGTLTAPDLDLNMEWQLGDEVMEHIEILVLDEAASGQYQLKVTCHFFLIFSCLQIRRGHEHVIRQCFQPILDDIERMYKTYEMNKVDEVFIVEENDNSTFVSSNVMRNQLRGLSEISWEEKESRAALRCSALVNEMFY